MPRYFTLVKNLDKLDFCIQSDAIVLVLFNFDLFCLGSPWWPSGDEDFFAKRLVATLIGGLKLAGTLSEL